MSKIKYYIMYGLLIAGLLSLLAGLEMVDEVQKIKVISEGGIVETISGVGYFVCALLVFVLSVFKKNDKVDYWHLMLFLSMLGMREFDFHCRFTVMGITKTKFYISSQVPFGEKIAGFAALLLFAYTLIYLVKNNYRRFFDSLKAGAPYAIGIGLGFLFLCITKLVLDGSGYDSFEEILEMGVPLLFALSIMEGFLGLSDNKNNAQLP